MTEQRMTEMRDKDPFLGYAASHILDHAERALSRHMARQDGDRKREYGEDCFESLETSQRVWIEQSQRVWIEQWLQQPGR